jgi:hypothetical protein
MPGVPWKLMLIWSLEEVADPAGGAIWAGTIPGGLFRSTDRRASWQLVETLWQCQGAARVVRRRLRRPGQPLDLPAP